MENQQLEWKETWRDDYLKWICGFANTNGGVLEIGKNDRGDVVGVENAEKLLEDLPNKIKSGMGIIAEVNICYEPKPYIKITVSAYPNPISYRGKYYIRSGSTNQELTGYALDEFLLRKYGRTWDSSPVPRVDIKDFYHDAFDIFRKKAVSSRRLASEDIAGSNWELLQSLKLTENDYLLKAALLLFYQDPDQYCLGSYVKIGFFENDADLLYQDEIGGSLIEITDRIIDIIFTKYFKGIIHYEGIQRIDYYPMPREVLREAVLNAVVHRDYSTGNPIHIKIYADRVIIYNSCSLPSNSTSESLILAKRSNPHNPLIANTFFRSGQIEAWGRGIEKMKNGCIADNLLEPEIEISDRMFSICFHIRNLNNKINGEAYSKDATNFGLNFGLNEIQQQIITLIMESKSIRIQEIAEKINLSKRNVDYNLKVLKNNGFIERVGSKKTGYWQIINQMSDNSED